MKTPSPTPVTWSWDRCSLPTAGKSLPGFCQSAWDTLSPFVLALSHGGEGFYDGWMKNPQVRHALLQ